MSGFIYNTIKDQAIVAYFHPCTLLLVRKQVGAVAALALDPV